MLSLTFEQFKEKALQGNLIPLYKEIPADLDTPVSTFLKIQSGKNDFLLESVVGGEKWGRFSFLGTDPSMIIRCVSDDIEITRGHKKEKVSAQGNPLQAIQNLLSEYRVVPVEGLPRFSGGLVGFFGYDMVRTFEKIPSTAVDEMKVPQACLMLADTLVVFDNFRQVMQVVVNLHVRSESNLEEVYKEGLHKIERLIQKINGSISPVHLNHFRDNKVHLTELKPLHTEEEFCVLVERAKEYIKAGDIFQVQISTRFEGETNVPPFALYRAIRRLNPSPYLYFLQMDDLSLVGASPEVMVRVDGKKVELRPIAGTRRRGHTNQEDQQLEKELRHDPKERAEHVMLVDLGRNDLGRVCEAGSVHVGEQEVIEKYSHVMHLVSHVSGTLKAGLTPFDVLRNTFPAGTLTGAPKIRAMEIIEELEGRRRGTYGGCVGYISFDGNMDMAITIRTALFYKGKITIQAAGGIVYDSVPRLEYKECCNKARGMVRALESLGV